MGLMQLMPATAKGLGVNPYVPESNVQGGIHLDKQFSTYWSKAPNADEKRDLTFASYNAGPAHILRAQKLAGGALTWLLISAKLPSVTGQSNAKQTCDYIQHIHNFYEQIK